ncbi:MAG: DUF2079 domain-containing protein [Candidatus Eremiobacteraeota bacterium]|nr:DUF2079 domain-containing protein [Candidatus Eremiobacteraeota bacterium]
MQESSTHPTHPGRKALLVITGAVLLYTALFFFFAMMRAKASSYGDSDLGIFGQAFHTTLFCGEIFYNTFEGGSHFMFHNSPVFFLIVPLYALHPGIYTLLFIMTCAIASGAYPVYFIAREKINEKGAVIFALLYLLYHPLHGVNYCQFHELAFTITPLLWSYYFFMKRSYVPFWICCILAMLCKEEISITTAAYGIYLLYCSLVRERLSPDRAQRKAIAVNGAVLVAVSFLYLYLSLHVIIPHFKHGDYPFVSERYGNLGTTLSGAALHLLLNPQLIFKAFWDDVARVHYIVELLLPLAFLSLWELPVLLIALPNLFINIMSTYSTMYLTGSRYPSVLIPFIFISAILGAHRLISRKPSVPESRRTAKILAAPVILTVLCAFFINPSPLRLHVQICPPWLVFKYPRMTAHQRMILSLASQFPRDASIATQLGIYHHLCGRKEVYACYHEGVDYIFIDRSSRWYTEGAEWKRFLPGLAESGAYELIFSMDYLLIYRRKDLPEAVHFKI